MKLYKNETMDLQTDFCWQFCSTSRLGFCRKRGNKCPGNRSRVGVPEWRNEPIRRKYNCAGMNQRTHKQISEVCFAELECCDLTVIS